jgi:hypothetical protein
MQEKSLINTNLKKAAFATLLLLFSFCAFSQSEEEGAKRDKFFAGGNFGLAFGRYTLISLNPQVGYRFNRFLGAGLGMNLVYASQKERFNGINYSKTTQGITGLNTFVRFYPIQRFLIQVQPEANYIFGNIKYYNPPAKYKLDAEIVPSILVGGGLVTPSERGAMLFTVMYDVLQKPNSPYGNRPVVNVGYNFNF